MVFALSDLGTVLLAPDGSGLDKGEPVSASVPYVVMQDYSLILLNN